MYCQRPDPQISHEFSFGQRIAPSGEHASAPVVVVGGATVVVVGVVAGGLVGWRTPEETPVSQSQVI